MYNSDIAIFSTPFGQLVGTTKDEKLVSLKWILDDSYKNASKLENKSQVLRNLQEQLEQYFSGEREKFSIPILFQGTDFQKEVWKELLHISYGTSNSYQTLAISLAKPKAYRAIANACAKNPFVILLPCHRVLRSNGHLGGYVGGVGRKSLLLSHENINKE